MVGRCLLNSLLEKHYQLVRQFVVYMQKGSRRLMTLTLDPRLVALASIIALSKKLAQGTRLGFEKI